MTRQPAAHRGWDWETGQRYAIGTRAVIVHGPKDWRVVCATCGGGGATRHETAEAAIRAATLDSNKRCTSGRYRWGRGCGAT